MSGEIRPILRLALPLVIGQLAQMLMGVVDTKMVGLVGTVDLAALTFANVLFHVPLVFGMGLLTCISVRTSNARGSADSEGARTTCRHGLYLALGVGLALFLPAVWLSGHLSIFGQPIEVTARTPACFNILMASMIPALISIALKNHSDALDRPWPAFYIFMGGVGLNVLVNWLLIFGKFGFPKLGLEGAAWGTFIARWAIVVGMFIWFSRARSLQDWVPRRWFRTPVIHELRRLLVLGWPASIQMLCEVGAFSAAALLVGRFGTVALASHQVALMCAAMAFMVPWGLSMALTVRIGEALGAGHTERLRPIVLSGWMLATGFAVFTAGIFVAFGKFFSSLIVSDPSVIAMSAAILVIIGIYQIVDCLQVASAAMLRGLHDVRLPALMGFCAYWIVGIPCGAWLAYGPMPGPRGVWAGLAIGLAVAAFALCPRLWNLTKFTSESGNSKKL